MLRTAALLATCLTAILLTAPATLAVGTTGPYAGVVEQGETKAHHYDNNPSNNPCIEIVRPYTVVLTYAPPTDTLVLSAGGKTSVGSAGGASVTFTSGYCTAFDITVGGMSVGSTAAYTVTVLPGVPAVA